MFVSIKKSMSRLSLLGVVAFTSIFLFILHCDDGVDGPEKPVVTDIRIDTLCRYGWCGSCHVPFGMYTFQNAALLDTFLNTSGYYLTQSILKEMTHKPDSKKWTYFAYVGTEDYELSSMVGEDTITINYMRYLDVPYIHFSTNNAKSRSTSSVPNWIIAIHFIPFTKKHIKLTGTVQWSCGYEEIEVE